MTKPYPACHKITSRMLSHNYVVDIKQPESPVNISFKHISSNRVFERNIKPLLAANSVFNKKSYPVNPLETPKFDAKWLGKCCVSGMLADALE